jgi:hypothetical protein
MSNTRDILSDWNLAKSLAWEITHGMIKTTGCNKLQEGSLTKFQTSYCRHMEPSARAVERLTSALEGCLNLLDHVLGTMPQSDLLSAAPVVAEGSAALDAAKNWKG